MGLTNTQYDEIMRDYQRRQNQARQELHEREKETYQRIPELSALDAQIAAASTACARALLAEPGNESSPPSIASLRAQIEKISERKTQLLRENGFSEDYLTPHYQCPDCQDTGYIGQEKCHCFRQATIDLLYTRSNLRENIREENFSDFSLEYYSETIKDPSTGLTAAALAARALSECQRFVREFDEGETANLFLSGDTGLGKTFLSHCVANELLASTHSVIYFSAFRLFELLADSSFGRTDESEASELERHIFECDLLIIDDLGTELVNSFVASRLFLILNERILRRKSTMISTNLSLAAISERYSERVLSRISSDYRMLRLVGDDIRIQKKLAARQRE
ncbi:MAG: ATP-binding protein [Lachnospiraceae bacterium]|nr:ATP-binding protein [Lachnospiraceae bacterium]